MILSKALPYVCFICGLGTACSIDSALSFYPGILLMLSACMIWIRRLENQHKSGDSIRAHKPTDSMHSTTALLKKP
jgi:hypothetical protein